MLSYFRGKLNDIIYSQTLTRKLEVQAGETESKRWALLVLRIFVN